MKAIVVTEVGEPEVLRAEDVDDLSPAAGELLVKAAAIGINFIEVYQRSGVYQLDLPFTPGSEAAGTVVGVGDAVTGFAIGDRVVTSAADGAYAEQVIMPAQQAAKVPSGVDFESAVVLALQGCTAHYLATSAAKPQPGDTALVHAGAGGVGQLLTQLLVARGVHVFTTASTEDKRRMSLELGAQHSFGYEDFADRARELTGGEGVAVVYDGVGKNTFDESLRALRVRGEMVLFGGASGQVPPFDLQRLNAGGSLSITRPSLTHFMRTPDERAWRYRELFEAFEAGSLRVEIGGRFALADAADAHRALASRGTTGKLILAP